jgi:putative redox protein
MTNAGHSVSMICNTGYKTEIKSRNHTIISDEPIESNGTDTGMNPYELLLSAIGACKAITMRMYAQRKGLPLEDISIDLSHTKIPAEECSDCETKTGKIDKIDIRVNIKGDLTEEQKARILEIGERCPVQRTILSEIKLTTTSV